MLAWQHRSCCLADQALAVLRGLQLQPFMPCAAGSKPKRRFRAPSGPFAYLQSCTHVLCGEMAVEKVRSHGADRGRNMHVCCMQQCLAVKSRTVTHHGIEWLALHPASVHYMRYTHIETLASAPKKVQSQVR